MKKLTEDFYNRDTVIVAKDLLGKYLVHNTKVTQYIGKITEVEAYLGPHDLACHASKGITPRTKIMFGPPGYAYIYLIYGIHHCMNIVTESEGSGSAVLIRALEPYKNIITKTTGPGLLCNAMEIDKDLNGHYLLSDNFYVAKNSSMENENLLIAESKRIGVHYAKEWAHKLLRFYISGNKYISKLRPSRSQNTSNLSLL